MALTDAINKIREKCPDVAVMLISSDQPKKKICLVAHVPQSLIDKGLKANEWVQKVAGEYFRELMR